MVQGEFGCVAFGKQLLLFVILLLLLIMISYQPLSIQVMILCIRMAQDALCHHQLQQHGQWASENDPPHMVVQPKISERLVQCILLMRVASQKLMSMLALLVVCR